MLTPATRKKFNKETKKWEERPADAKAGLLKWASPSVFREPSTILTNGDINQIERTVVGRQYLEDLQKRRKVKKTATNPLTDSGPEDTSTPGAENPLTPNPRKTKRVRKQTNPLLGG